VQDLIEYIARSLADDPTQVHVSQFRRGATIELRLQVSKEDMGRVIGRSGRVVDASVAASSGSALLDEVAVAAVRKWTFVPARRGARAVESVVEVPVKFALSRQ